MRLYFLGVLGFWLPVNCAGDLEKSQFRGTIHVETICGLPRRGVWKDANFQQKKWAKRPGKCCCCVISKKCFLSEHFSRSLKCIRIWTHARAEKNYVNLIPSLYLGSCRTRRTFAANQESKYKSDARQHANSGDQETQKRRNIQQASEIQHCFHKS